MRWAPHIALTCLAVIAASPAAWLVFRFAVPTGVPPSTRCRRCATTLPRRGVQWLRPPRRCPACRVRLTRHPWACHLALPPVYAALSWRLAASSPADALALTSWLACATGLAVIAGVDAAVRRIPHVLTAATATAAAPPAVAAAFWHGQPLQPARMVLCCVLFAAVHLVLAACDLIGMADVYLAGLLGFLLGSGPPAQAVLGSTLPYAIAFPVALVRLARGTLTPHDRIAWGPFLVAGALAAKILIP